MLISSRVRMCVCGAFPIPTSLRDSDKASAGGELNVIPAVGGAGLCVSGKKKPHLRTGSFDLEI